MSVEKKRSSPTLNSSLSLSVVQVFRNYLTFCGLGLSNAQLFELSIQEYKKNQVRRRNRFVRCFFVLPEVIRAKT